MTAGSKIYLVQTISTVRTLYAVETTKNLDDPNEAAVLENFLQANTDPDAAAWNEVGELQKRHISTHIEAIAPHCDRYHYRIFFDSLFPELKDISGPEKDLAIFEYDLVRGDNQRRRIPDEG